MVAPGKTEIYTSAMDCNCLIETVVASEMKCFVLVYSLQMGRQNFMLVCGLSSPP